MRFDPRGWSELIRSLGEALVEVLRAEIGALEGDLQSSGRQLVRALLLLALTAAVLFWMLGALTLAAIEIVALWLPRWGAASVVTGGLLLLVLIFGFWGAAVWRRIETPGQTIRRRWDDHQIWWRSEVLAEEEDVVSDVSDTGGREIAP